MQNTSVHKSLASQAPEVFFQTTIRCQCAAFFLSYVAGHGHPDSYGDQASSRSSPVQINSSTAPYMRSDLHLLTQQGEDGLHKVGPKISHGCALLSYHLTIGSIGLLILGYRGD